VNLLRPSGVLPQMTLMLRKLPESWKLVETVNLFTGLIKHMSILFWEERHRFVFLGPVRY
jgi:hypothetical protein